MSASNSVPSVPQPATARKTQLRVEKRQTQLDADEPTVVVVR